LSENANSLTDLFKFNPKKEGRKYLPIIYNENYDISFWKLEGFHPFDTHKWNKVHNILENYFEVFVIN
jgi:hypothetical protein